MCELKEKVVYLQGLTEGMEIAEKSKEGKVLVQILDILADMAETIDALSIEQEDLSDYIDELDSDLAELEEDFYDIDDCDCDCDDDDCDCFDDEEDYVEMTCPNCSEVVCFDADIVDSDELIEVVCPVCDSVVFVNDGEYQGSDDSKEEEDK